MVNIDKKCSFFIIITASNKIKKIDCIKIVANKLIITSTPYFYYRGDIPPFIGCLKIIYLLIINKNL